MSSPFAPRLTPAAEALNQEQRTVQIMDEVAKEDDFILQQQQDDKKRQSEMAAQQRAADAAVRQQETARQRQLADAKRAGVRINVGPDGTEDFARHDDGSPLYESGFVSTPQQTDQGPMVDYRDPRGQRFNVPLAGMDRSPDPTGAAFYEFDIPGPDGAPVRVRQPENASKPLFKVDSTTGERYTEAPDTVTGTYTRTPLGLDRVTASQVAIQKRKEVAQRRQADRSAAATDLMLTQNQRQTAMRPIKDTLTAAQDAFDKIDKAKVKYRNDPAKGMVALWDTGTGMPAEPVPVEGADLPAAKAWLEQYDRAKADLQAAKDAHDPLAKEIQEMQVRRDQLAIDTHKESRAAAQEVQGMEDAAKRGVAVYEPDWQKRLKSLSASPRMVDVQTVAGLADAGDPLAEDVERVGISDPAQRINRIFDLSTTLPPATVGSGVIRRPQSRADAPLSAATRLEIGQQQHATDLRSTILQGLAADNTTAASKDATTLATEALGITDPENWQVTPNDVGAFDLSRDGQHVGVVDTRNNRINLLSPRTWEEEQEQARILNANKDGLPIYYLGDQQPMRPQELRDFISSGIAAASTAKTDAEAEQKLAEAGMAPSDITKQVRSGRLSVQDGRMLLDKLYSIQQVDNTPEATRSAFQRYLAESPVESSLFKDPSNRTEVVGRFFDSLGGRSNANILVNRSGMAKQREAMMAEVAPKEGVASRAGGFVKELIMPMIGIGGQAVAVPFQETLHLFGAETEAGRLSNEEFGNWLKRSSGFIDRIDAKPELSRPLGELENWADGATLGDDVPQELADRIASAAYDLYHQLNEKSAKDLNTTRETFDVNKDPVLRGMVQNYLQNANPSVWQGMLGMLTMDARDRETQTKVMAYIEAPRTATAGEAMERAKLAGLDIDEAKAKAILALGKQMEGADQTQAKNLMKRAQGLLGTTTPQDTDLALGLITRKTSDDPNSYWGLTKSGFVTGRHELATELLTTGLEAGVVALTGGAASPEVLAARAARAGTKAGVRMAIKNSMKAGLDALAHESKAFAAARSQIGRARQTVGSALRRDAAAFAELGIKKPTFGQPLTRLDKVRNFTVAAGKTAGAAVPMESLEEAVSAIGEPGVSVESILSQAGMGALGGVVLGPMFTGAGALAKAWQQRGGDARMGELKAKWAEGFNRSMAGTPGFRPMRPEDFETAIGVMNTPAHQAAQQEYLDAVAALESAASGAPATELNRIHALLAELAKEHGARETPTPGEAGTAPQTRSARVLTTEESDLLARRDQLMADPASTESSAAAMAAQARVDKAATYLAETSAFAFDFVDEIRHLPAAEQPLYSGIAKAMSGAREFTEAESKALIGLQGQNAAVFSRSQALPQGIQGPPARAITDAPTVTPAGPSRYRLPDNVNISIPPQAVAMLAERAPSLAAALGNAQAIPQAPAQAVEQASPASTAVTAVQDENPLAPTPATDADTAPQPTPQVQAGTAANALPSPQAAENLTRQVIGAVVAKSKKLKKMLTEVKEASPHPTGGMWMNLDGSINLHVPTMAAQLEGLDPQTAARRIEAVLDEEIRHSANMEAARRLYGRQRGQTGGLQGLDFETWLDAWYSDIWDNHFTEAMRQQVHEAYGATLPEAKWMRAMEGLRMLDQLRATGSITESILQHLAAVLDALREFLSGLAANSVVRQEIDSIQEVLREYGYEGKGVKPEKAKKKAHEPKAKDAAPVVTPEPLPETTDAASPALIQAMERKAAMEAAGGLTGAWKPVAADEPTVPAGMVRFYHAGVLPATEGRWLSPYREWVKGFRPGLPVSYVDIPVNDPQLKKSFVDDGVPMSSPFVNFEADAATSTKLTELPNAAAPASTDTSPASIDKLRAAFDGLASAPAPPAFRSAAVMRALPDAILGGELATMSVLPDYPAAKAGDNAAALRVAEAVITPEFVERVRSALGGELPAVVPVSAIEAAGRNRIPIMAAHVLSEQLGLPVVGGMWQAAKVNRSAATGLDRIFTPVPFVGHVEPGQSYLLIDDTLTQGGTFAGLASHIASGGGHVVGIVALTGKAYSAKLSPSDTTLARLRELHGDIESNFQQHLGYDYDSLTESEARYLANFRPAHRVRARILEAGGPGEPNLLREQPKAEGLASAPASQVGLPADRRAAFLDVAESLISDGVRTPEAMSSALRTARPDGSLDKYSQALWNSLAVVEPSLTGSHDWSALYAAFPADAPAQTPAESAPDATGLAIGSIVRYEGYVGRVARDGQRMVVEIPGGTVVDVDDVTALEKATAQERSTFGMEDLRSTAQQDPALKESTFSGSIHEGGPAITDESARIYVPHNRQLLRSVVDTPRGLVVRLRRVDDPGRIVTLTGDAAQRAQDALIDSAGQVEESGGKVNWGTARVMDGLASAPAYRSPAAMLKAAAAAARNISTPPAQLARPQLPPNPVTQAILAGAYRGAARGQSAKMVPIRAVWMLAKAAHPEITIPDFLRAVGEADNRGEVLLESYDTPAGLEASGPFVVKNAMGVPSINMMVPEQPTLASAPAASDGKQAALKAAVDSLTPVYRQALEMSLNGTPLAEIAKAMNLSELAVGSILPVANARVRFLLQAGEGKLKPTVQVEGGQVKGSTGRPDLAMSGNARFTAVDQRRQTPEEVTHGEMEEAARQMFAADPDAAERLVVGWMDSGTTVLNTDGMPEAIQRLVADAKARMAAEMLMTAAAKLLVSEKAISGADPIQTARLIDLYRTTGTEQARALNMRYDPHAKPEARAAMFISEALLTPPESILKQIRQNPANKEKLLAAWALEAQKLKEQLKAQGYDIDATFASYREEQKLVEATVPQEVRVPLSKTDGKTRALVKAVLEGKSWGDAAAAAQMPLDAARKAYQAFRDTINTTAAQAAAQAREMLLASAPVDYAAQLGLPDWNENASPDYVPVKTEATKKLKEHRAKKKVGGEFDLADPAPVKKIIRESAIAKSTALDKVIEFRLASMLSGPRTAVVNLASGLSHGLYESTFKKLSAAALADFARLFGFKPDAASLEDVPAMVTGILPALKEAYKDAIKTWNTETNVFDAYALNLQNESGSIFKEDFNPALKGKLGKIMRSISFRHMGMADAFVKSFFSRIEVGAQARQIARNEGLKGRLMADRIAELMEPGSPAWERSLAGAKRITFQNEEVMGAGGPVKLDSPLTAGSRAIDSIDGFAKLITRSKQGDFGGLLRFLSHAVFPFVQTPTNIFKAGVTMSPLGGLLAIVDAVRSFNQKRKGNAEEAARIYNAARALDDLTNQIVAWGFVLAMSELVKPGDDDNELPWITGTMDWRSTSPGEREIAYRTAPPQSIRIGDRWISYRSLDPFASALAFTVDSIKQFQSGKPMEEAWAGIGLNMMKNMQDKTFLQGMSDIMNAIQDPERFGSKWATNMATGFLPNLIRQPIRTADDVFRENDLPNDIGFWDALGRRVGYSVVPQMAPPAVDIWGRDVSKQTGTGSPNTDWMLRLFMPADMKTIEGVDPLDVALHRYNMTADKPFGVTAPSRELSRTIGGKQVKISLTDAEYLEFVRKAGAKAREALGSRFDGRVLTPEDVETIKEVISKVQSAYRADAFVKAYGERRKAAASN